MGALKEYIDGASDAARDRVITEQNWTSWTQYHHATGARCLLGVVNNAGIITMDDLEMRNYSHSVWDREVRQIFSKIEGEPCIPMGMSYHIIAGRFNRGYDRWGMRFVALLKEYAARRNAITITVEEPCKTSQHLEMV